MTTRYIEVASELEKQRLLSALLVRWYDERRAYIASWQLLPDAQVPAWYVQAGRPAPPTAEQGTTWAPWLGRWVWHIGECPNVEVFEIGDGSAVVRVPDERGRMETRLDRWKRERGDALVLPDADLIEVAVETNRSEILGRGVPADAACVRARLRLGLGVPGKALRARSEQHQMSQIVLKPRAAVVGKYAAKLDEAEQGPDQAQRLADSTAKGGEKGRGNGA